MNITLQTIQAALGGRVSGDSLSCCCPAHDDKNPSLSVTLKDDRLLVHCHTGCSQDAVVGALKDRNLWPVTLSATVPSEIIYQYKDEDGLLLFEVVRKEGKRFTQRRLLPGGGYEYNLNGIRRVLYRLPDVVDAIRTGKVVLVAEGEKDADTLTALGLTATTNPHGAGKWRQEYSEAMRGADVVVCGDNDGVGEKHAANVTGVLLGKAKNVRQIKLPKEFNGYKVKDVTDFIAAGGTAELLLSLVCEVNASSVVDVGHGLIAIDLLDFLKLEIPIKDKILPWMPAQSLCMIHAWRGVGKTYVALNVAYAIASGGSFLGWKVESPRKVLYVDGEMPASSMQTRLAQIVASSNSEASMEMLKITTPDYQINGMPDLATKEGQEIMDALITDEEVIIIDNLSCLVRGAGNENEAESWLQIQQWALRHRSAGRTILFIHHSGKNGNQRGTSKKEDILDTVICLKRPADYEAKDGAVFEVHFEKARHLSGEDLNPFEARLSIENDRQKWTIKPVEDTTFDRVVSLKNEGLSPKEIAQELAVNKSTISRHLARARDGGLIIKDEKVTRGAVLNFATREDDELGF